MSLVVIYALGQEAAADAYLAFCNANNPDASPGAQWYPPDWKDRHGQRVVGYLGPDGQWNAGDWPEPEGGEAARGPGVLQDGFDTILVEGEPE
jgi:hypothetical protein